MVVMSEEETKNSNYKKYKSKSVPDFMGSMNCFRNKSAGEATPALRYKLFFFHFCKEVILQQFYDGFGWTVRVS